MPIYEYECKSCGHRMEAIQKIADDPLTSCPECSEESLKKLMSAVAFRLKGGGWYETDFKTGDKKNLSGDKKPEKAKDKDKAKPKQSTASKKPSQSGST